MSSCFSPGHATTNWIQTEQVVVVHTVYCVGHGILCAGGLGVGDHGAASSRGCEGQGLGTGGYCHSAIIARAAFCRMHIMLRGGGSGGAVETRQTRPKQRKRKHVSTRRRLASSQEESTKQNAPKIRNKVTFEDEGTDKAIQSVPLVEEGLGEDDVGDKTEIEQHKRKRRLEGGEVPEVLMAFAQDEWPEQVERLRARKEVLHAPLLCSVLCYYYNVYMYRCINVHICIYVYTYIYKNIWIHVYMHKKYTCVCVSMYISTHVYMCMYICVYVYIGKHR